MLETIFKIFAIIGVIIICILAFIIPSNPFEIIPAMSMMSFDKPLWLCIILCGSFFYLIALWSLYRYIDNKKIA